MRGATQVAKIGPASEAVGRPTIMPNRIVSPTSALYAPTASIAAGCGGSIPCTTESPATSGMPILMSDSPVRRAIVNTSGTSRTNPTWKKTGIPTMKATTMMAQWTRRSPKRSMRVVAMREAAPDSAIILPSIVPSPSTIAIKPSTLPTPS